MIDWNYITMYKKNGNIIKNNDKLAIEKKISYIYWFISTINE